VLHIRRICVSVRPFHIYMLNLLKYKSIKRIRPQQPGTDDKLYANPYTFIHTNLDHGSEDPTGSIMSVAGGTGITIQITGDNSGLMEYGTEKSGTQVPIHTAPHQTRRKTSSVPLRKLHLSQSASTFYEILNTVS